MRQCESYALGINVTQIYINNISQTRSFFRVNTLTTATANGSIQNIIMKRRQQKRNLSHKGVLSG